MISALDSLQRQIRLSPAEARLFKLLPSSGKQITTKELAALFYEGRKQPFNSRIVIIGLIRNLQKKINVSHVAFRLKSSERAGPYPMKIWRESRERSTRTS